MTPTATLRSLVVALTLGLVATVASAQPSQGTAPATNTNPTANGPAAVTAPSKGAAAGASDAPATPAGSAATGSAATGSAATGSAAAGAGSAVAGQGSAAPIGGLPATGAKAWYDVLANRPIDEKGTFWMPKAVNKAADDSDMMFYAVLALSAFFFFAITACVIFFTIKYRHRPGHKPQPSPAHNDAMEITWTVIPTIITVFLFWFGWRGYIHVVTPPNKAVEINLLAKRWAWQFTHSNGVTDSDLHVPVNTPVRLVMTSTDVLHSFYAPAFRVKQDIIPRRYTYAWFYATKPGTYRLTCAEYCGTAHAQMSCLQEDKDSKACLRRAVVVVHAPGDYERYLNDKAQESSSLPPAELGAKLFDQKGCNACHTTDGSTKVGPSFKMPGTWGADIQLAGGGAVKMDENYIRESILSPQAKARPGFPPSMPSFEGQLKEAQLNGLVEYIKSLRK